MRETGLPASQERPLYLSPELRRRRLNGPPGEVVGFLASLPGPVRAVYEAGPTGFGLARAAREIGIDVQVVAPDMRVAAGKPLSPAGDVEQLDAALRDEMVSLLHRVQEEYPHPEGAFWVPQRLGGSAPTVAEAKVLKETEKAARARKRAERGG